MQWRQLLGGYRYIGCHLLKFEDILRDDSTCRVQATLFVLIPSCLLLDLLAQLSRVSMTKNAKIAGENRSQTFERYMWWLFSIYCLQSYIVQKMLEKEGGRRRRGSKKRRLNHHKRNKFNEEPIPPNHDTVDNKRSHAVIPSHTVCIHHFVQWCKTQAPNHY